MVLLAVLKRFPARLSAHRLQGALDWLVSQTICPSWCLARHRSDRVAFPKASSDAGDDPESPPT